MAVYVCKNRKCLFTFERAGTADICEDCGSLNVRDATDDEIQEYLRNRDEADENKTLTHDQNISLGKTED